MIEEDYVSFETAKALQEKGFDWEESPFYSEQDRNEWKRNAWYSVPNPCYNENVPFDSPTMYVTAPHVSLQMAMKWLREKYSLEIYPYHNFSSKWWFEIIKWPNSVSEHESGKDEEFDTYEEACEAAIKYCLKNLI